MAVQSNIKDVEKNCLNNLFRCKNYKNVETKKIIENLKRLICVDFESPDFILENDDVVIGLEHFLVDTLKEESNLKCSVSREIDRKISESLETYEYGKAFKDDRSIYEKAVKDVGSNVVKVFNTSNNLNNKLFIEEFNRIALNHKGKCKTYKENIKKYYKNKSKSKEITKDNIPIYFLIEIKFKQNIWIVKEKNGKEHTQKIKGIPFTEDFVKEIKKVAKKRCIDYIILYFSDVLNQSNDELIFAFSTENIDKVLIDNKIKVYADFKTKLDGERVEVLEVKSFEDTKETVLKIKR